MGRYRQVELERFDHVRPVDPEEIKRSEQAKAVKCNADRRARIGERLSREMQTDYYPASFGALKASYDRLWAEYEWLLEYARKATRERDAWEYAVDKELDDDGHPTTDVLYASMEEIRQQLEYGKTPQ